MTETKKRATGKRVSGALIKNAVLLTVFSLACKGIGMLFRLYLSVRIGAEGMGLYQLVMSVYTLFSAFATAGFTVAVSRLVAERLEQAPDGRADGMLNSAFRLSLLIALAAAGLMAAVTNSVSGTLLGDVRTRAPLYILALSLPFMAVTSCLKGAFMAYRKVLVPSSNSLFEQIIKTCSTMLCFGLFMQHETDIGRLCVGIVIGVVAGEISSFIYLSLFYVFGIRPKRAEKQSLKPFARVAMPIAASSYVTSILHTVENVLIPYCLALFGNDRAESLAQFGLIRGMVIPIVFFPFAFLSSLVSILIPEISRLNTRVDKTARDARIERVLFLAFVFSTAVGGVFFFFPEEIAVLLYKDAAAAPFLRLIALVTPFMYVETIADGLLKSIGEQVYTLKTSIINSVCRIVIIYLLVPRTGAMGYTYLLIASNTFAFLTCMIRIRKKSAVRFFPMQSMVLPLAVTVALALLCRRLLGLLSFLPSGAAVVAVIGVFVLAYFGFYGILLKKRGVFNGH